MTGAGYFVISLLTGLVLAQAAFIAMLYRDHAKERQRLYSMAFASTTPELVALMDMDTPEPKLAKKAAPKPAETGYDPNLEPVGGGGFGL